MMLRVILLLFFAIGSLEGHQITTPPIPDAIPITIVNSQMIGTVHIGSNLQSFSAVLDIASSLTWVPSADCKSTLFRPEGCEGHPKYDSSSSKTSNNTGKTFNYTYDGGDVSGSIYVDSACLNSTCAKALAFGAATKEARSFKDKKYDGTLGLAYAPDTIFWRMYEDEVLKSSLISIYINKNKTGGALDIGGINVNHFGGALFFTKNIDPGQQWTVKVEKIIVDSVEACSDRCSATLSSVSKVITGPSEDVATLQKAIGATLNGSQYTISCSKISTVPEVIFYIGNYPLTLYGRDYIIQNDDSCISGFVPNSSSKDEWILGEVFFAAYYTMFDIKDNQIGFAVSSNP